MDLDSLLVAPEPDFKAIAAAVERHRVRLVFEWAHAHGMHNANSIASQATQFARIFEFEDPNLSIPALALARTLLAAEGSNPGLRGTYKMLFSSKPKQIEPVLRLFTALARTGRNALASELYNNLDLTLKAWPKIWESIGPIRTAMSQFFLEFVAAVPNNLRRDLLTHRRFAGGWLSHIANDTTEQVEQSLAVLVKYILNDDLHGRQQRLSFFTDSVLGALATLLARDDVSEPAMRFLERLFFDQQRGIAAKCADWAQKPAEAEVHNRVALALLKKLRPWDNLAEQQLSLMLLRRIPELAPPYYTHLAARYPFAPKLSMFWIGYSAFLAKCLSELPLTLLAPDTDFPIQPTNSLVESVILPPMLQRNHLLAALNFTSTPLVQFQATQIIAHSLSRLEQLFKLYSAHKWDSTPIYTAVAARLPEPRAYAIEVKKPLLQTALLTCVRSYCRAALAAEQTSLVLLSPPIVPPSLLSSLDEPTPVSGLALVRAEDLLEIQAAAASRQKWWHPAQSQSHAFSTTLLRFACLNPKLADRCASLLAGIASTTLLFADGSAALHPAAVLISTLENCWQDLDKTEQESLLKLIDESIARCIRSPYSYVDAAAPLITTPTGTASPLAMALLEQSNFSQSKETALKFAQMYARNLWLAGEPLDGTRFLFKLNHDPACVDFLAEAESNQVANRTDLSLKIGTPLEAMAAVSRASREPELAEHLYNSIPVMFASTLSHPAAVARALSSSESASAWANFIRGAEVSSISEASLAVLADSEFWTVAMDLLPPAALAKRIETTVDPEVVAQAALELSKRKAPVTISDRVLSNIARHCTLGPAVTADLLLTLANSADGQTLLDAAKDATIAGAIITATKVWDSTNRFASSPAALLAAARQGVLPEELASEAVQAAFNNLRQQPKECISLLAHYREILPLESLQSIAELASESRSPLHAGFAQLCNLENDYWKRWLRHAVLSLTKALAESVPFDLYSEFVHSFQKLLDNNAEATWKLVSPSSVNALISASISSNMDAVARSNVLGIAGRLVLASPSNQALDAAAHLQVLLTRAPQRQYPVAEALMIWSLFKSDPRAHSTPAIQSGLLCRWGATRRAADSIIAHCLRRAELETGRSWAEDVEWEFDEPLYDFDLEPVSGTGDGLLFEHELPILAPTFILRRGKLTAVLSKHRAQKIPDHYDPGAILPEPTEDWRGSLLKLRCHDVDHPCFGAYTDEFVLGVAAACPLLLYNDVLDSRPLLETQLLGAVMCAVSSSSPVQRSAATAILAATAASLALEDSPKPRNAIAVQLIVSKLLCFLSESHEVCSSHLAVATAHILRVAVNPTHVAHDRVRDWLLAGPSILPHVIPLYSEISESETSHAPAEAIWLLNVLAASATNKQAVEAFTRAGAVQWAGSFMVLQGSRHSKLRAASDKFITRAAAVEGGTGVLMRRAGLLAWEHAPGTAIQRLDVLAAKKWARLAKRPRVALESS